MTVSWELLNMRARLRLIDTELVILLARRFQIMREVRDYKDSQQLPLIDRSRERDVLEHTVELARSLGVPDSIVRSLYEQLFEHVRGPLSSSALMKIKVNDEPIEQNHEQAPERPVIISGRGKCHD